MPFELLRGARQHTYGHYKTVRGEQKMMLVAARLFDERCAAGIHVSVKAFNVRPQMLRMFTVSGSIVRALF